MLSLGDQKEKITRINSEELISAQKADEDIGPVYTTMMTRERTPTRKMKDFSRASQLLFQQKNKISFENGVLVRKTVGATQIILPKIYRNLVYEELHGKLGHLGSEKVVELARKRLYWPYIWQKKLIFI